MNNNDNTREDVAQPSGDPMAAFFTRQAANDGVQLPLYSPTGLPTSHWLRIRGVDSDEFRAADTEAKRAAVKSAALTDQRARDDAMREISRDLVAHLVMGWSFDKECTHANVVAFLKEAPQLEDAIDKAATRRALFFAPGSSS